MRRIITALFLGIGLLALAGGGVAAWREVEFRRGAVETDGTVIQMLERTSRDRDGHLSRSYTPVFTFSLPDGSQRRVEGSIASNPPCCTVGERIRVRYRPEAPERAYRTGFAESWLVAAVLGGIGLIFTVVGLVVGAASRRTAAAPAMSGAPPGWAQQQAVPAPPAMGTIAVPLVGLRQAQGAWILQAGWTDPRSGARRLFESPPIPFDPVPQMRRMTSVNVSFDPAEPNGPYAMDLSFLHGPG